MFVLSNFLVGLAKVLAVVIEGYQWIIIARALVSWVNPDPFNPIVQFLQRVTEPVLDPIRRRLPPMAIDISPVLVILALIFLKIFLVQSIYDLAFSIR